MIVESISPSTHFVWIRRNANRTKLFGIVWEPVIVVSQHSRWWKTIIARKALLSLKSKPIDTPGEIVRRCPAITSRSPSFVNIGNNLIRRILSCPDLLCRSIVSHLWWFPPAENYYSNSITARFSNSFLVCHQSTRLSNTCRTSRGIKRSCADADCAMK